MGANPLTKWNTPEGEAAYPTVGSNSNRVAASLAQPTIARRKASKLSSVERSALMDDLVNQLIDVKKQVREMNAAWQQTQLDHRQRIERLETSLSELTARFVGQRGLKARLSWMLFGR